MSSIDKMVAKAIEIANDDTHGYSQVNRLGPDYDCSSYVSACLIGGGFDVPASGNTRTLFNSLIKCGWHEVTGSPKKGDIYVTPGYHCVLAISATQVAQASMDECGGIEGKQTGDQTGKEIYIENFYTPSYGWQYHMRYDADWKGIDFTPEVGKVYRLLENMNVRHAPGITSARKTHSELTTDGQAHDKDKNGSLDAGTLVTCKQVQYVRNDGSTWIRIPSGWIAAIYGGEVFIENA